MPTRQESVGPNDNKPLDQLELCFVGDDGVGCMISALNKRWTTRTVFASYISLIRCDGQLKDDIELQEWQHEAELFQQDMQYLLQCSHHVFWSYMVYQKAAIASVVSFLQHATPFYLDLHATTATQEQIQLYEQILCKVLRLICRLITNRESSNAWLRKEHMTELIYTNYLITMPMLFDLVVAIGDARPQNAAILRRIFQTVLELEPKYKNDLLTALAFFRAAFRSIQTQSENEGFEGAGGGTLDANTETPYDDVVLYTLDCAFSLSVVMEVCPLARTIGAEINLAKSIANFYDTTIPNLYKNICQINENANSLSWLNQARLQFLTAFRSIAYSFVERVLANPDESLLPVESFLALMTDCLSEQTFVVDYERQYPIAMDMDILKQACPDLDEFKASFVVQGYQQEAAQQVGRTYDNIESLTNHFDQVALNPEPAIAAPITNGIKESPSKEPIKTPERDMDLEVTAVLDMLPHLGTGFVMRLLSRYESSDQAVTAILEGNLPPDLANADQNEPYIPPDPQDKVLMETGVQHFNVHDGDAYDVMTQDKPKCVIKRGKGMPNAPRNAAQMLDDKSDLQKIRHRYQAYSLVAEDHDENDAEYDDEYDDSYEALLESETRVVRSKDLKAVLANVVDISEEEDDDDEDENDEGGQNGNGEADAKNQANKRMNFCENPEVIRARYEAKRQAKWGATRSGGPGSSQPKHDVVGAPKGQGQDKETLRSRQKKEANKSSRANHNRKSGAAFKRSRGMVP